jgi:uncharacterized membrane protein (TIGR02234 family)
MAEPGPGRRTFGPVVLLGLTSAALAAVASAKPWLGAAPTEGSTDASMTALDNGTRFPLASALSLVLLATWGVLLVTRGRVRRAFALLAALAALALLVSVVAGYITLPDSAGDSYEELMGRSSPETGFTGWFWTAAVCSVVALVPAGLAVRLVGQWPEMGSRYDAPGAAAPKNAESSVDPDRNLWSALDEGRDPTDTSTP